MRVLDPPLELTILHAPDRDRRARAGPDDQPGSIRREGQMGRAHGETSCGQTGKVPAHGRLLAGRECLNSFSRVRRSEQAHQAVFAASGQDATVGREGDVAHAMSMVFLAECQAIVNHIPDRDLAHDLAPGQFRAIGRECDALNPSVGSIWWTDPSSQAPGPRVEEADSRHGGIRLGGRDQQSVRRERDARDEGVPNAQIVGADPRYRAGWKGRLTCIGSGRFARLVRRTVGRQLHCRRAQHDDRHGRRQGTFPSSPLPWTSQ